MKAYKKNIIRMVLSAALLLLAGILLTWIYTYHTEGAGLSTISPMTLLERTFMKHIYQVPNYLPGEVRIIEGFEIRSETPDHYWYINEYKVGTKRFVWEGRYNKKNGDIIARIRDKNSKQMKLDIIEK